MRYGRSVRFTSIYQPLGDFLQLCSGDAVTLSFADVETILGRPLPPMASRNIRWWGNKQGPTHARVWRYVGWETRSVNLQQQAVTFVRVSREEEAACTGRGPEVES
jgi:hypothetical protein